MPWRVDIMESERGWGQRRDSFEYFVEEQDAWQFVKKYNACNNLDHVPDWYMYAADPEYVNEFDIIRNQVHRAL